MTRPDPLPEPACGRKRRVKVRPLAVLVASVSGAFAVHAAACVPAGSAPPYEAGAPVPTTTFRPSFNIMTAPFEESFDRPDEVLPRREAGAAALLDGLGKEAGSPLEAGDARLEGGAVRGDTADPLALHALELARAKDAGPPLGANWVQAKTGAWRIEDGRLCGQGAKNHPVWLTKVLPVNARIEFDAVSYSDEGDLKAEIWGDGRSAATSTSYTNASSYLAIFGGWKNTIHALARLNEHGKDRKEVPVDKESDDPRQRAVQKGQTYRFKIERSDGKTVKFSVDGVEMLSFVDAEPLAGEGHDHFGFNEWEVKTCFDNVRVTPL